MRSEGLPDARAAARDLVENDHGECECGAREGAEYSGSANVDDCFW